MAKNGFAYGAQSTANLTDTGMVPLSSESMIPKQAYATFDARNIQVDGGVVEDFISEKRIGKRIKDLRLKKSMGLVELGRHTGLSASFLSQLEIGRAHV